MHFLSRVGNFDNKTKARTFLQLAVYTRWLTKQRRSTIRKLQSASPFNAYVAFVQSFKCRCISFKQSVSKFPCKTLTYSNWKWMSKYVDFNNAKRIFNFCSSVKYTHCSNPFITSKSNSQYYHSNDHCTICATMARLDLRGEQQHLFIFYDLFLIGILI
jgi:hypothetical protein